MERRISTVTEREISSEETSFKVLTATQAKQRYDDVENYFYGWSGHSKDQSHAVKLYREAAANGNVLAQYRLACCYENGDGLDNLQCLCKHCNRSKQDSLRDTAGDYLRNNAERARRKLFD